VPFVTSQPDPRSFVVELRDVVTAGVIPAVTPDPRSPIAGVRVDTATAADGAAVARVNVTLSQPGRPRVRSSRNLIIVEADRADAEVTAAGAISAAGPAAVIRDVRFEHDGRRTSVTLVGTGRLDPLSVRLAPEGRRRLLLEFANVSSAVPQTATPGQGPVSQVRIGLERPVAAHHRGGAGTGAAREPRGGSLRRRPEPDRSLRRSAGVVAAARRFRRGQARRPRPGRR
jgi:hypothetical protein